MAVELLKEEGTNMENNDYRDYSLQITAATLAQARTEALRRAKQETGLDTDCFEFVTIQEPGKGFKSFSTMAIVEIRVNKLLYDAHKEADARLKQEQEKKRQEQEEKLKLIESINDCYEYEIVTVSDNQSGRLDTATVAKVLAEHSKEGWRLVNSFVDEVGKNSKSTGYGGISETTNATICEVHFIFERCIKRWQVNS